MANISKIKLPNDSTTYDVKDSNALPLSGGTLTGVLTTSGLVGNGITSGKAPLFGTSDPADAFSTAGVTPVTGQIYFKINS